jgi:ribosomal-protein-alanine N-acetyltransferase
MATKIIPPARVEYDERLIIRPVEPKDIPIIEKARNETINDLHVFMDWSHQPLDRQSFLDRILIQWGNYFRGDEFEVAMFDKNSGAFLVYTGFYPSLRINPNAYEIGFWTSAAFRSKGYATLATQIQIVLIFEYFKGDRIEITASVKNQASLRVIQKCGFHYEGELRNFYPQGSDQMFAQGYIRERKAALFSLIPDDRVHLPWYEEIMSKMTLHPLLGPPELLSHLMPIPMQ